jgi:hypothetical protein
MTAGAGTRLDNLWSPGDLTFLMFGEPARTAGLSFPRRGHWWSCAFLVACCAL